MEKYQITTQRQLRRDFWENHPRANRRRRPDGDYCTDTRVAFCDWVEYLSRSGTISPALANRVTL